MNCAELTALLRRRYVSGEAQAIARLVMEDRFGLTLTDLALGKDRHFSLKERAELENIAHLLASGVPVQHVLGHASFCERIFDVTPDVLIPRPETEDLVQWVLGDMTSEDAPKAARQPVVTDMGTGSGCIAISICLGLTDSRWPADRAPRVIGLDVSKAALDVARRNACRLGADVEFLHMDMLQTDAAYNCLPTLDVIVSNPPYIRQSEAGQMEQHVLAHEPHLALFVPDDDPLRFYRAIAHIGHRRLANGGHVYVELNRALGQPTAQLFESLGYDMIELRRDRFGNERMLRARLKR